MGLTVRGLLCGFSSSHEDDSGCCARGTAQLSTSLSHPGGGLSAGEPPPSDGPVGSGVSPLTDVGEAHCEGCCLWVALNSLREQLSTRDLASLTLACEVLTCLCYKELD